jgi:hypothetical protein
MKIGIDVANLLVAILACLIGVGIAFKVSKSADHIGKSGVVVSAIDLLADHPDKDDPWKRCVGATILSWQEQKEDNELPDALAGVVSMVFALNESPDAQLIPPSAGDLTSGASPNGNTLSFALGCSNSMVSNKLSTLIAGRVPRLFVIVPDQRTAGSAKTLRDFPPKLPGDLPVLVPSILRLDQQSITQEYPDQTRLFYLYRNDKEEADGLRDSIQKVLGHGGILVGCPYNACSENEHLKHTFELWFASSPGLVATAEPPKDLPGQTVSDSPRIDKVDGFSMLDGIDFPGQGDYRREVENDELDCALQCKRDKECEAFTFLGRDVKPNHWNGPAGPMCFLKNKVWQPVPYAGLVSGVKAN